MADEKEIKTTLIEHFGVSCWGCTDTLTERQLVLDHIVPQVDGGSDEIYNRALICFPCNSKKGDRLTLSALRTVNKEKAHAVVLKGALRWTREHFLKSLTQQLELFPTGDQTYSQSGSALPDYDGNGVRGLQELRWLLHIRGFEKIAMALQSVVSFKASSGGYNNLDTYIEMIVGDIQDYNFLKQGISEEESQRLWDAVCEIEGVTIWDESRPYVTLRPHVANQLANDQHDPYGDGIDDLPF